MDICRGELLAQQISKFSPMSICEGLAVQRRVFADGVPTRAEAEALFEACATFAANDSAWKCAFVASITQHLLGQGQQFGFFEFDGEDWLMDKISSATHMDVLIGFELLKSILEQAQNASEDMARFSLATTLCCMDARIPSEHANLQGVLVG